MSTLRTTAPALLAVSSCLVFVTAAAVPASAAGPAAGPAVAPVASPGELCVESRQLGHNGVVVTTPGFCVPTP